MNRKLCYFSFILISFLLIADSEISAQENFNIECISQYYYNWDDGVSDIAVQDNYAYLACFQDGFRIVDLSNYDLPVDVSHIELENAYAVAVSGNYAFVAGNGISVIDVTDPAHPAITGSIISLGIPSILKIESNMLYAGGNAGLSITDISDPLNPEPTGLYLNTRVNGFDIQGHYAYIADRVNGMYVWDISNPLHPELIDHYTVATHSSVRDVSIADGYAYLACDMGGLEIVDLSTMQQAATVDSFECADVIEAKGDYLYLSYGCPECPLAILDITNRVSPQVESIYYPPADITNFTVVGDVIYVAFEYMGMRALDVSAIETPREVVRFNRLGFIHDVRTVGSLAYINESTCLTIIDVSDSQNAVEVGRYEPFNRLQDFEIVGTTAFLTLYMDHSLEAVDISDPTHPQLISTFSFENPVDELAIFDHYALAVDYHGVHIVDISDPTNMHETGFYQCLYGGLGIEADDRYVYVMDMHSSYEYNIVVALDMTDPANPVPVATWNVADCYTEITAANGLLFASARDGVRIFDTNNLQSTDPISILEYPEQHLSVFTTIHVDGQRLYLSNHEYGIWIYDIQDIFNPQLVGAFQTPGSALNSFTDGDILYLADGTNFGVYDCSGAVLDVPHKPAADIAEFALLSNYPNPFNSTTQIQFEVAGQYHVSIAVFDVLGRQVATLADQVYATGTHVVPWNGTSDNGSQVASGRYFVMAKANDAVSTIPVVLLK